MLKIVHAFFCCATGFFSGHSSSVFFPNRSTGLIFFAHAVGAILETKIVTLKFYCQRLKFCEVLLSFLCNFLNFQGGGGQGVFIAFTVLNCIAKLTRSD